MKKRWLPLAAATTLAFSLTVPYVSSAGPLDNEIKELRQEVKKKQEKQKKLKQQLRENKQKQQSVQSELSQIAESLEQTKQRIQELNDSITETEAELEKAKEELQKAEARVEKRDALFKDRIRLMYENGHISYLGVLLGAKDFGDFLARFESIQLIMKQDKQLLVDQKRDRNMIAESKQTIEAALAKLNSLHAEAEEQRQVLAEKQEKQKVVLASLQQKHDELEEINEKEAQRERELAAKLAAKVEAQEQQQRMASSKPAASTKQVASSGGGSRGSAFRDSGGTLAWPARGSLTSGFRPSHRPNHNGIDISAPVGRPIYAAHDGIVTSAQYGYNGGYGNKITIAHGGGLSTLYAHIRDGGILVKAGDKVKRGQKIAEVGSTGRSTGPHLHFEVLEGSTPVNPMTYLR